MASRIGGHLLTRELHRFAAAQKPPASIWRQNLVLTDLGAKESVATRFTDPAGFETALEPLDLPLFEHAVYLLNGAHSRFLVEPICHHFPS